MKLPDFTKMITLGAFSSEEKIMNFLPNGVPGSLIYPAGVLIPDMEINRATPKAEKAPAILPPLQRK